MRHRTMHAASRCGGDRWPRDGIGKTSLSAGRSVGSRLGPAECGRVDRSEVRQRPKTVQKGEFVDKTFKNRASRLQKHLTQTDFFLQCPRCSISILGNAGEALCTAMADFTQHSRVSVAPSLRKFVSGVRSFLPVSHLLSHKGPFDSCHQLSISSIGPDLSSAFPTESTSGLETLFQAVKRFCASFDLSFAKLSFVQECAGTQPEPIACLHLASP